LADPFKAFSDSKYVFDDDTSVLIEDAQQYESPLNAIDLILEIAGFTFYACVHYREKLL
jgi:hypothetical protein